MPFESERQRRFVYTAAAGKARKKGAPSPAEARSFIEHSGGSAPKRKLRARRKRKRD